MIVVGADHGAHRDDGVATWTVLDHNRLPPPLAQSIAKETRAEVHATAGTQGDNELYRPLRPSLRRQGRNKGSSKDQ
jgi:hypothetical protein